jgi:hypothetical protein
MIPPMSESDERPSSGAAEVTEDDRRRAAAERNRKRVEEEWGRNKRRWLDENFPDKPPQEA